MPEVPSVQHEESVSPHQFLKQGRSGSGFVLTLFYCVSTDDPGFNRGPLRCDFLAFLSCRKLFLTLSLTRNHLDRLILD